MFLNGRVRRLAGKTVFGIATLGAGCTAMLAAAHPASASAFVVNVHNLITCGTTSACVSGANTNSGPGVAGTSAKGVGVLGSSAAGYGMQGSSSAASSAGVRGEAKGTNGSGVSGFSPHGFGVNGTSSDGYGVYGSTGGTGTGAYGGSVSGIGVNGRSLTAYGVLGLGAIGGDFTGSAIGLIGRAGAADGFPFQLQDQYSNLLLSVSASGAMIGTANGGGLAGIGADFSGTTIGLIGRTPVGGYPLVLTDSNGAGVFYADASGNLAIHGSLYNYARTAGGATVKSFSPKTTLPTVEDTGTAQLIAGAATVAIDPTFAASIDARGGYRVFLTPSGDTRGLFVATRNMSSFTVRESQGGRATVSFDYRIVATALGQAGQRMSVVPAAAPLLRGVKPAFPKLAGARPTPAVKLP